MGGKEKVPISHLLFTYDLLLFGRVGKDTNFAVRQTPDIFCKASGQKVNELKRKLIFSPNASMDHKTLF